MHRTKRCAGLQNTKLQVGIGLGATCQRERGQRFVALAVPEEMMGAATPKALTPRSFGIEVGFWGAANRGPVVRRHACPGFLLTGPHLQFRCYPVLFSKI